MQFLFTENYNKLKEAGKVSLPSKNESYSFGYDIHLPIEEDVVIEPKSFKSFNLESKIKSDSEDTIYQAELYMPKNLHEKGLIFANPYFRFAEDAIQSVKVYNFSNESVTLKPDDVIAFMVVTETIVNEPLSSKGCVLSFEGKELPEPARQTLDLISTENIEVASFTTGSYKTGISISSLEENKFALVQLNDSLYTTYGAIFADGFNISKVDEPLELVFLNLNYAPIVIPKGLVLGTLIVRDYSEITSFDLITDNVEETKEESSES